MSYSIQLIQKNEQTTAKWSGGDTTQLAIYPADADYTKRDFTWRISSANVKEEESVFTPLPDIERLIMVLDGDMTLDHEGHHRIHLTRFEQDRFSGGWTTRSYGKVRDFNLMLSNSCEGALEAVVIRKDTEHEIISPVVKGKQIVEAFYCVGGPICIKIQGHDVIDAEDGDLLLLNRQTADVNLSVKICNQTDSQAHIVRATIFHEVISD